MPRRRQATQVSEVEKAETTPEATGSEVDSEGTNTNTTSNRTGERKMALTSEQIAALLSQTRSKGEYVAHLNTFVGSGEQGICVNDEFVSLAGKKTSTLKQGFENAKNNKDAVEGADKVKVIVSDEKVYLLNLAVVQAESEAA